MTRARMLAIGLVASLALNVFVIAYGATLLVRQPPIFDLDAAPVERGLRIADMLPEEAGGRLRAQIRGLGPQLIQRMRAYRQSLLEAAAIVRAETVDRTALKAVLDEARAQRAGVGDLLTEAFVETAAELPIETRRKLLETFRLR